MAEEHVGALISLRSKTSKGIVYQGRVASVSTAEQSLTIDKPFINGIPSGLPQITISAADVTDLKILRPTSDFPPVEMVSAPKSNRFKQQQQQQLPNKSISSSTATTAANKVGKQRQRCIAAFNENSPTLANNNANFNDDKDFLELSDNDYVGGGSSDNAAPVMDGLGFIAISNQPISTRNHKYNQQQQQHQTHDNRRSPIKISTNGRKSAPTVPTKFGRRPVSDRGPCGIPQLDEQMSLMEILSGNRELGVPLDQEVLKTDFDFEANLALFDKAQFVQSSDGEGGDDDATMSNAQRRARGNNREAKTFNYRHDENIVNDPARVYSWVNGRPNSNGSAHSPKSNRSSLIDQLPVFPSCGEMHTADNIGVPAVSSSNKRRLLETAAEILGEAALVTTIGDRLSQCVFEEIEKSSMVVSNAVIVVRPFNSGAATMIAERVAVHLANRQCHTTLFGAAPRGRHNGRQPPPSDFVNYSFNAESMPDSSDVQLVVSVCDWSVLGNQHQQSLLPKWLHGWLGFLPRGACVVSFEAPVVSSVPQQTLVMTMVPTFDFCSSSSSSSSSSSLVDTAHLVDVGIPFSLVDGGVETLVPAYGTRFTVALNLFT